MIRVPLGSPRTFSKSVNIPPSPYITCGCRVTVTVDRCTCVQHGSTLCFCRRLKTARGLPALKKTFEDVKFKGKGHEVSFVVLELGTELELGSRSSQQSKCARSLSRGFWLPPSPEIFAIRSLCWRCRKKGVTLVRTMFLPSLGPEIRKTWLK